MGKITVTYMQVMTSDDRLVEMIAFDYPVHSRAAIVAKIGLGKNPVTLIQPTDYKFYRCHPHQSQMQFLKKNIWRPGKNVKLKRAEAHERDEYPIHSIEVMQNRAKMFSTKAVNALNYVIGVTPGKPLENAIRERQKAVKAENRAIRNKYYSAADGSGIF